MKPINKYPIKKFNKYKKCKPFIESMGLTEIYDVPIRKKGMTGSGEKGGCVWNSLKLQSVYGGKLVLGFVIDETKKDNIELGITEFISHQIWETPEGNWVDVTLNWNEEDTMLFSPMISFEPQNHYFHCPFSFGIYDDFHRGILRFSEDLGYEFYPRNVFKKKRLKRDNHLFHRDYPYINTENKHLWDKESFTKPSTSTGKYFSEMWERYLKENPPYVYL